MSWTDETKDPNAEAWLSAELVRIWLLVEQCLRRFQKAQLRPGPDHPSVAELEGIFTAQRRARRADPRQPDPDEIAQSLAVATDRANAHRPRSPLGQLAASLELSPAEVETVALCLAPQIDPPIADVYTLIRGSARRGVDLALVATLHRMARQDRVSLLDVLDPERPLLAWGLVQALPSDAPGAAGSMMFRSIVPHFDLVSAMAARPLPRGLRGIARFLPGPPAHEAPLDPVAAEAVSSYTELVQAAAHGGRWQELAWLLLTGRDETERRRLAAAILRHTGRPVLAFDPGRVERTELDEVFRRIQREALLRGAVLYVGPLPSGRAILRRLGGYPGLVVLSQDADRPPLTMALDRALWPIELSPALRVVQ